MRVEEHDEGFKPMRIVIETSEEMAMIRSTLDYARNYLGESAAHHRLQVWIEDLLKELE